jgi:D-glycero-D-manno-heptose 1,7-bisphosphate phosphatase
MTEDSQQRRFIILDRDGTIIEEREYLSEPDQVTLIPGAGAALRELQQMGFGLVVITNQSGVGRGIFDHDQLERVHQRFKQLLDCEGVRLDGVYVCPHAPDDNCACRKPKLGLIEKAAKELGFKVHDSIVIGDKAGDIEMGRSVGALTFLVRTGYGAQVAADSTVAPDYVVESLPATVPIIRRILTNRGLAL